MEAYSPDPALFLTGEARQTLRFAFLRALQYLPFASTPDCAPAHELQRLASLGLLERTHHANPPYYRATTEGILIGAVAEPLACEQQIFSRRGERMYVTPYSRRLTPDELPRWAESNPLDLQPGDWFLTQGINPHRPTGAAPQCVNWVEADGRFVIAHVEQKTRNGDRFHARAMWNVEGCAEPVLLVKV